MYGFDSGSMDSIPPGACPRPVKEAVYTNLGPGSYRFHVIASNADEVWNGPEATLSFSVDPALWQTLWFRLVSFASLLLIAMILYRLRFRATNRQGR
jgi:hypothetical protein